MINMSKPSILAALLLVCLAAPLFAAGDVNAALIDAAKAGNTAAVRRLASAGADVNTRDKDGATVLSFARPRPRGSREIVDMLYAAGARF